MIIDEKSVSVIKKKFNNIDNNVDIYLFVDENAKNIDALHSMGLPSGPFQFNEVAKQMIEQIGGLSDKLNVKTLDLASQEAKDFGIERSPTILMKSKGTGLVVYTGLPLGHEFTAFIDTIVNLSKKHTELSQAMLNKLNEIKNKTHIYVFVTPTCPYCPYAVILANELAIENENIIAETVEAQENPALSQAYNVSGVPQQVINKKPETITVGVQQPDTFINQVVEESKKEMKKEINKNNSADSDTNTETENKPKHNKNDEDPELVEIKKKKIEELKNKNKDVKGLNTQNFDDFINSHDVTVIDLWAEWCKPCKMIEPLIKEFNDEMPNIWFGRLNVDMNKDVAVKYSVMSIPTLLVFKQGKLIDRIIGFMPKPILKQKILSLTKG